jgi:hypothetical protein
LYILESTSKREGNIKVEKTREKRAFSILSKKFQFKNATEKRPQTVSPKFHQKLKFTSMLDRINRLPAIILQPPDNQPQFLIIK